VAEIRRREDCVHAGVQTRRPRPGPAAAAERFLFFRVGGETYGTGIESLWEVLQPDGVTELPTPAHQICTALAYRGQRLPLVRLAELFGVPADRVAPSARVLLLDASGSTLGVLVDQVEGVIDVPCSGIAPMPFLATQLDPRLFRGVCARHGRVVVLLSAVGLGQLPDVVRFQGEELRSVEA
jgi:purine-binding chemotaxis protein CheW